MITGFRDGPALEIWDKLQSHAYWTVHDKLPSGWSRCMPRDGGVLEEMDSRSIINQLEEDWNG